MFEKPITTPKRLVYNTVLNVATLVTNAIIGFFMIRFFLGRLGVEKYGIWVLVGGTIFRYAPLLNMGLSSSINRYIPVYIAEKNELGIHQVIDSSLLTFSFLALILATIASIVYFNVESWFSIDPAFVPAAKALVLIVGFSFAISMPMQLATAVLSGLQRFDIANLAVFSTVVMRTVILIVFLLRGHGLLTMGIAYGLCEITLRGLQFSAAKRLLPQMSLSFGHVNFKLLREMLAYGINTLLYAMGTIMIYQASNLIIGIFIGTEPVSLFTCASAGVLLLAQLVQAFTMAIKPAVSDLDARKDNTTVKEIAFLTQKYSLLLIIPGACFLIGMGREFLTIWVGAKFEDPTAIQTMSTILYILTVGHCLKLAQLSNFFVLVGRGQHRIFGILTILMAILCISSSIISVKVLNLGLIGIAWSNFLPMAIISGTILPVYFNRKMKISTIENIRRVWLPAIIGSLPTAIMIILWKYYASPDSWIEIICIFIAIVALTTVSAWTLSLKPVERKRFLNIALRRKN